MKCSEFMIYDWITSESGKGIPMKITCVDVDCIYANFEGNEGDPWEYDDKDYKPCGIPLTGEILKKNGFEVDNRVPWKSNYGVRCSYSKMFEEDFVNIDEFEESGLFEFGINHCLWQGVTINYVHELQHALRLAGFNDLADNFKVE